MAIQIKYVDGKRLYKGVSDGIRNLILHQKTLDEINVFPVPDGDTGTNMVYTLMPILTDFNDNVLDRADDTMNEIANLSLDSARGNSGTIIAQFFYGFKRSTEELETINLVDFSKALRRGYISARDSLSNPEEGTIITVMRDVARKSEELISEGCDDFAALIQGIYKEAEISLKATKTILKILRKSGVVDSGALGFVLIIQGVLNVIEKGQGRRIQTTHLDISYEIEKIEGLHKDIDFKIDNKFCTECVVRGNEINRNELKSKIKDFGDSMVIAGSKQRVKIHIHTNTPAKLFKMCSVYGIVVDKKVDDMTKQEHSMHHTGASSVAIITDSTADLPDEYQKEIHMVPVKYSFGRQQHIDKVTQSVEDFYEQMESDTNHPKTSQPSKRDFVKMYNFVSSHYNYIISIHLSKKLSGTYQSALNGSKHTKAQHVTLIDSCSASVGLGLLNMYAIDLKQSGHSYDEIIKKVKQKQKETEMFLLLDDLTYAVKGGRVPSKIKTIANLLRLKPILTANKSGKLKAGGVLFGYAKIESKFSNYITKKINPDKRYRMLIAHANCMLSGKKLENKILSEHKNIESHFFMDLGCGLGCHAGPGALVVGLQAMDQG